MKQITIGIVGTGNIARGRHIRELKEVPEAKITAICDIDADKRKAIGDDLGIPEERRFEDYRELTALEDLDAVEVCTPNVWHVPIALDALRHGKSVNIEKPLACNMEAAKALENYPLRAGQIAMMCFSYRFMPATRYAKHLVDGGMLGDVTGVEVAYLKDSGLWEGRGLEWRFDKPQAGTGVLGDLGVHLLDMTQLLAGPVKKVCGRTRTVITERPYPDGTMGKVTTDDVCDFLAVLESGADVTFNINRCALGHRNTIRFDIFGTRGAISFNLNKPEGLYVTDKSVPPAALEWVEVPEEFKAKQEATFVKAVLGEKGPLFPTIEDGLQSQRVLDAIEASAREERWVTV